MKNLIVTAKSVKLLEENISKNLHDLGLDNSFLYVTQNFKQQKKETHYTKSRLNCFVFEINQ